VFVCAREKIGFAGSTRLGDSRPNSAAGFRDLLVRFAACASLKVVEPIAGKNQMRM
jgi:hypothetical protein